MIASTNLLPKEIPSFESLMDAVYKEEGVLQYLEEHHNIPVVGSCRIEVQDDGGGGEWVAYYLHDLNHAVVITIEDGEPKVWEVGDASYHYDACSQVCAGGSYATYSDLDWEDAFKDFARRINKLNAK